jgi:hypothetical protein
MILCSGVEPESPFFTMLLVCIAFERFMPGCNSDEDKSEDEGFELKRSLEIVDFEPELALKYSSAVVSVRAL